jgi:hypothetical protein
MCFVWISEQIAIISLYSINWLVFITETECVYRAVRNESSHIHFKLETEMAKEQRMQYLNPLLSCTRRYTNFRLKPLFFPQATDGNGRRFWHKNPKLSVSNQTPQWDITDRHEWLICALLSTMWWRVASSSLLHDAGTYSGQQRTGRAAVCVRSTHTSFRLQPSLLE